MLLILQRIFFITGAVFYVLCLFDGAAATLLAMKWREGEAVLGVAVWEHLEFNMGAPLWFRDALFVVFPDPWVAWALDLPASLFFPARVIMNLVIGRVAMTISDAVKARRG